MSLSLDDARAMVVKGHRLDTLGLTPLRMYAQWNRNRLTTTPDDPELLALEEALRLMIRYRLANPLSRVVQAPDPFAPPARSADPSALPAEDHVPSD